VMPGRVRPDDRTDWPTPPTPAPARGPVDGQGPVPRTAPDRVRAHCDPHYRHRGAVVAASTRFRAHLSWAQLYETAIDTPPGFSRGRRSGSMGDRMRSCIKIARNDRNGCGATALMSPRRDSNPNLLIRTGVRSRRARLVLSRCHPSAVRSAWAACRAERGVVRPVVGAIGPPECAPPASYSM